MDRRLKAAFIKIHLSGDLTGELFERQITFLFKTLVKSGDHVVDGGASYGRHSRVLANFVGDMGRVYCFEPLPKMVEDLNRLKLSNITVFQMALGENEALETFFYVPENSGYSGLRNRQDIPGNHSKQELIVTLCKLDKILGNRTTRINLIKLDLEGGEFYALRGCSELLRKDRPVILFENGLSQTASLYGYSEDDFFQFFESIQYKIIDCFGETIDSFQREDEASAWQFIAHPKEISTRSIKFRTYQALIKSAISVLKKEDLSQFQQRVCK